MSRLRQYNSSAFESTNLRADSSSHARCFKLSLREWARVPAVNAGPLSRLSKSLMRNTIKNGELIGTAQHDACAADGLGSVNNYAVANIVERPFSNDSQISCPPTDDAAKL